MANCCQKVRGNKPNQRKQTNKNREETKQLTEWSRDVIIIIDLRDTQREEEG